VITFLILGMIRIGEASNPGPSAHFDADFTVGTFNPSGLRFKENYFQSQLSYGDIWTVAETHFFGKDVSRFRASLKALKVPHKYCVTDQTSVKRGLVSATSWKGVGVLSKHPTRQIPTGLPQHAQDSGRALLFTTLLGDAWLTGSVVYGEPNSHQYPAYLRNNEVLLHHVVSHVCNLCVGPRFVSGDWNVQQDSLPAFGLLAQAGFRDIQDIALERWGMPIQATCKGRTRPDFLYVSPELADLLFDVDVIQDVWPDHAVLMGRFRKLSNAPSLWVWPAPEPLPWPRNFDTQVQWPQDTNDMSQAYADLWAQIEHDAVQACPLPVAANMKGRGQRNRPKKIRTGLVSPVKIGRKGDFQPEYFGSSLKHAQWIRQTRRLQAFAGLATNMDVALGIQKAETWGAIMRAPGFSPCFADWWEGCGFKTGDAPAMCPLFPPSATTAHAMYESLVLAVRNMEAELKKTSRQYAKFKRDQNPNLVFMDIRPSSIPGVDILMQPLKATVEAVDGDTGLITLDKPYQFCQDRVFACNGHPLQVIHHEADALWVEDVAGVEVGSTVSQTRVVGTHDELEHEFVQAWRARWMRHAEVPASRWEVIVNFAKRFLPRAHLQWDSLTPVAMKQILRTKKKRTSHWF
jgi:hypothetical protein